MVIEKALPRSQNPGLRFPFTLPFVVLVVVIIIMYWQNIHKVITEVAWERIFNVSHPDLFIYTYIIKRISQTQQFLLHKMLFWGDMFRLPLSHLQTLLKYSSKVNNVHSVFWDPIKVFHLPTDAL